MADALYESTLLALMGGYLSVNEEVTRALARAEPDAFLSLPFAEAVRAFRSRNVVSAERWTQLDAAARSRSFTATQLATDALVEHAHALVVRALEEGSTLREFGAALTSREISLGIEPSSSSYIETLFRTNVASAYGAGRYSQLTSPAVRAARPYVEYRAAGDARVRPNHRRLHGLVFRQDDPHWPKYMPPGGFNCRCVVVARRAEDVDESRVVDAGSLGPEYDPDPGWATAPSLTIVE